MHEWTLISKLDASAFATYATKGTCENSKRSRILAGQVKKASITNIESVAKHIINDKHGEHILNDFLNPNVTLVPVPRSSPMKADSPSPWASLTICEIFQQQGLGQNILNCIKRISAVPKSQFAGRGNRPTVETHLPSLEVQRDLMIPDQITLIDDVVTKGSTTFACAIKLHEMFPDTTIRAFAVFVTRGFEEHIDSVISPCVGEIVYSNGETSRKGEFFV